MTYNRYGTQSSGIIPLGSEVMVESGPGLISANIFQGRLTMEKYDGALDSTLARYGKRFGELPQDVKEEETDGWDYCFPKCLLISRFHDARFDPAEIQWYLKQADAQFARFASWCDARSSSLKREDGPNTTESEFVAIRRNGNPAPGLFHYSPLFKQRVVKKPVQEKVEQVIDCHKENRQELISEPKPVQEDYTQELCVPDVTTPIPESRYEEFQGGTR